MHQILAKDLGLIIVDRYSVDTLTQEIITQNDIIIERYLLKAKSSPSPRKELYENIPCSVIRPTHTVQRIAVMLVEITSISPLDILPRIHELLTEGYTIFHVRVSMQQSPASILAQIVKAISYASLRRDIIDHIYLWSVREIGVWGILASVFDERIEGIILDGVPTTLRFSKNETISISQICEGITPKPLVIINVPNIAETFHEVSVCYKRLHQTTFLRLEEQWDPQNLKELLAWLLTRRNES
jgi:hypothetical protein